jgi:hypothetical protein
MRDRRHQFLLEQAGADKIKHSGRTLFDHLVGTHDLLRAWGNSDAVCDAGLFHSIYGTNKFRHQTWPITDRATIRDLIGPTAELLAFMFCTSDRPAAWFEFEKLPTSRSLREIEAANLLEQGSRSKWLGELYDTDISGGARRAIKAWRDSRAALSVR